MSAISEAYDALDSLVSQFGDDADRSALDKLWNKFKDNFEALGKMKMEYGTKEDTSVLDAQLAEKCSKCTDALFKGQWDALEAQNATLRANLGQTEATLAKLNKMATPSDDLKERCAILKKQINTVIAENDRLNASWRCFHCGEVFTDKEKALEHFGWRGKDGLTSCVDEVLRRMYFNSNPKNKLPEYKNLHDMALQVEKRFSAVTANLNQTEATLAGVVEDMKRYKEQLEAVKKRVRYLRENRRKWVNERDLNEQEIKGLHEQLAQVTKERDALLLCADACKEFVRKVECGEARSKQSYAQMKVALTVLDRAKEQKP
jgi:hypothetical protein